MLPRELPISETIEIVDRAMEAAWRSFGNEEPILGQPGSYAEGWRDGFRARASREPAPDVSITHGAGSVRISDQLIAQNAPMEAAVAADERAVTLAMAKRHADVPISDGRAPSSTEGGEGS